MVKLFSTDHTFHHPFEHVSSAFWRKYPNERAAHVKAVDVIDRSLDSQGNLTIKRVIKCESQLPQWLLSVGVPSSAYAVETTVVNALRKQMVVRSRNITGSSMLVLEESCIYRSHPTAPFTAYTQQALITSFLPVFKSKFESFTLSNLHSKSKDGLATMEALCQRIQQKGIKSLIEPLIDAAEARLAQIHLPTLQNILPTATNKDALLIAGIDVGIANSMKAQANTNNSSDC